MKQQKSHYFKWGLTVFLTVCAILAFYDTFYMNGTLQRYLSKLVTVLAPVLYGFAMAYLLAPIVNWIEGLIRKGLKRLSKGQEPKLRGGLLRGVSILLTWAVVAYLLYLLMSVLIPNSSTAWPCLSTTPKATIIRYMSGSPICWRRTRRSPAGWRRIWRTTTMTS